MTKKEIEKIDVLIHKLDGAVGKLLVPARENSLVEEAMIEVIAVSFELSDLL